MRKIFKKPPLVGIDFPPLRENGNRSTEEDKARSCLAHCGARLKKARSLSKRERAFLCENHLRSLAFSFALASGDNSFPRRPHRQTGKPEKLSADLLKRLYRIAGKKNDARSAAGPMGRASRDSPPQPAPPGRAGSSA